jgi:DNA-binding MarR family transcriptional regulator
MTQSRDAEPTAGEAATGLILATFRANGALLAAGDILAADHGLTSARWQVIGAVALAEQRLTVPQIARRMGLTRQSVHGTVRRLVRDELLELGANEDHRRSPLVHLTDRGRGIYRALDSTQNRWINQLVAGMTSSDLQAATRLMQELTRRVEAGHGGDTDQEGEVP